MDNDDARYGGSARPPGTGDPYVAERIGLGAEPDEDMERFARLVKHLLGVPAALVSLVEGDRHIFPGLVGLGEPWASSRQVPLPRVGDTSGPTIDAEADRDTPASVSRAAEALGAAAWTGAPLTDGEGTVLGFLLAIDTVARTWSEGEREALHDLAHVCGAELRLRLLVHDSREDREQAQSAYERSQLLLRTADELADATDPVLVRRVVKALVTTDLGPVHVGLLLVEGDLLRRVIDSEDLSLVEASYEECALDSDWPQALAARTGTIVEIPDAEAVEEQTPEVRAAFTETGVESSVCVPLPGKGDPLGVLALGWDVPHKMDVVERSLLRALAEYTGRAVERAVYVSGRVEAAELMQRAMLTEVPAIAGLEIEALYRPAAQEAMVGGDWYDVYPLTGDTSGTVAITIGDITGHDIQAAIFMGQVRTMLRQADLDHPDYGPARIVSAFERANRELGLRASGTMVHAHLRPQPEGWLLTWTNAGHMGPLVASTSGEIHQLTEHDLLFHPNFPDASRTDHQWFLEPGSTLLMFTDGLVERRTQDMETTVARTARMLAAGIHSPLPELLRWIVEENVAEAREDDVALLAVRLKPQTTPHL